MPELDWLRRIAETDFLDIVQSTAIIRNKLRVVLIDGSYIDFWWSSQIPGRYAYHWERRHVDETIYRHDNMPHLHWQAVSSFPKHFHSGDQQNVVESDMDDDPERGLRQFLTFAKSRITSLGEDT